MPHLYLRREKYRSVCNIGKLLGITNEAIGGNRCYSSRRTIVLINGCPSGVCAIFEGTTVLLEFIREYLVHKTSDNNN